jgi:hypothetical protein
MVFNLGFRQVRRALSERDNNLVPLRDANLTDARDDPHPVARQRTCSGHAVCPGVLHRDRRIPHNRFVRDADGCSAVWRSIQTTSGVVVWRYSRPPLSRNMSARRSAHRYPRQLAGCRASLAVDRSGRGTTHPQPDRLLRNPRSLASGGIRRRTRSRCKGAT